MRIILALLSLASVFLIGSATVWSEWSEYGACIPWPPKKSQFPNHGYQKRSRTCLENADSEEKERDEENEEDFAEECEKETKETETIDCRIATEWRTLEDEGKCSVTCGTGHIEFKRKCIARKLKTPGRNESCIRGVVETKRRKCEESPCPVDGGWSDWSVWSACSSNECIFSSKKEQRGHKYRSRTCSNPYPNGGGKMCQGPFLESGLCTEPNNCPVDGAWSAWSPFGEWDCKHERRNRTRKCDLPSPKNGGKACPESSMNFMYKIDGKKLFNDACRNGTEPETTEEED